jgi:hypothetical protein
MKLRAVSAEDDQPPHQQLGPGHHPQHRVVYSPFPCR